jgi:general secretion pathway protein B
MSFILEALKKSENERQRTVGPSLADVPASVPRSEKPWWAFAVGALLVINLGILLVVLLRNGDAEPASSSPAPAQQVAPQVAQTPAANAPRPAQRQVQPTPHISSSPAVRSLADEATLGTANEGYPAENPNLAAAAAVPEGPPIVRPIEPPSVAPAAVRPQAESRAPTEPAEVLPTIEDLTASGTSLPEMHLDIHVHSPVPAERFVFVNMRKYVEGQTLAEGPAIERITGDGVVLNHLGRRFLLPRQ